MILLGKHTAKFTGVRLKAPTVLEQLTDEIDGSNELQSYRP